MLKFKQDCVPFVMNCFDLSGHTMKVDTRETQISGFGNRTSIFYKQESKVLNFILALSEEPVRKTFLRCGKLTQRTFPCDWFNGLQSVYQSISLMCLKMQFWSEEKKMCADIFYKIFNLNGLGQSAHNKL